MSINQEMDNVKEFMDSGKWRAGFVLKPWLEMRAGERDYWLGETTITIISLMSVFIAAISWK